MGKPAHLALHQSAYREHGLRKLLLSELAKKIALVLARVKSGENMMHAVFIRLLAAIMSCGHHVRPKLQGAFEERVEFDFPVAKHIRIRRAAFSVLIKHIVHYPFAVFFTQIDIIERYAYLSCDHLRHKAVLLPFTFSMKSRGGVMPVLHEQGKHIVAGTLEKQGRHARIHTAGKADAHLYC